MNEEEYYNQLVGEIEALKLENAKKDKMLGQTSLFSGASPENLIEYQLDLSRELDRIEHLLRGHIVERDADGNEYWAENPHPDEKPLNEYGVRLLMNVIAFYLNRNTILSHYDEETILTKIKDISHEINNLIFLKYDEMGMDTEDKRKLYPMIVRQVQDSIHSAYRRALNAGERGSLRTARHVTQSEGPSPQQMRAMSMPQQSKFKLWSPKTWV